jgi:hypothetical protein
VPVLFTEAARFQSWLDVEAALAELTIIPAEMPGSSIHGMLRAIPVPEVPARSDPAATAAIGYIAPTAAAAVIRIELGVVNAHIAR